MSTNEGAGGPLPEGLAVSVGWGDMDRAKASETYTWFHIPAESELLAVVLSSDPAFYEGHYMGRGVHPCSVPRCVHCQAGVGLQKRCVLSVYSLSLGARGLLEVGYETACDLYDLARAHGSLRGLPLRFTKEGGHQTGRILAHVYAGPLQVIELPGQQDPFVPLRAQWAKMALRLRGKDGPANVQHVGEADLLSTQSPPSAASSPPKLPTDAEVQQNREWLKKQPRKQGG